MLAAMIFSLAPRALIEKTPALAAAATFPVRLKN